MSLWSHGPAVDPRLRIQARNSSGRRALVIALDRESEAYHSLLVEGGAQGIAFLTVAGAAGEDAGAWTAPIESGAVDVVVLIATGEADRYVVEAIGRCCRRSRVKLSVLLALPASDRIAVFRANLRHLRPWADSVALVEQPDALGEMLQALGIRG